MSRLPDIIIFNPDQWRGDVLGHVGNPAARTPNLDALVESDAVSFSNTFCQHPMCVPSRCSFMTGWYPHVRGHRSFTHMLHRERDEPNLLSILKENGYFVWWGGKNHLVPPEGGFSAFCDVRYEPSSQDCVRWGHIPRPYLQAGHLPHPDVDNWRGAPGSDTYYSFFAGRLDTGEDAVYCDGDLATLLNAIDFVARYDGERPICLFLAMNHPHPPYGVEEPWFSLIDRTKLPPRLPTPDSWAGKPSMARGIWERQNLRSWNEDRWDELRATYYGMCAKVDHQFGMLMDALKAAGRYDDSAVFFFADHGDWTGDYGLVEKAQNVFDDSLVRVPFILKPPRGVPVLPRVSGDLVELIDFTATVYELTKIEPDYTHFGRSLLPLLAGQTEEHRDAVFCEAGRLYGERHVMERGPNQAPEGLYWPKVGLQSREDGPYHTKAAMCRTQSFKYVRRLYEQDELYDLEKDPGQLHNVVTDPAYAGILAGLKERMLTWYLKTCDVVPHREDGVALSHHDDAV